MAAPASISAPAFPFLLLPSFWSSRNRARRREPGDLPRAALFGFVAFLVAAAIFYGAFWVTLQLADYAELGDYLIRLGLSWLFLTFLSFLAFSSVVTSLSTFFLSDDLRLLLTAPIAPGVSSMPASPAPSARHRGWWWCSWRRCSRAWGSRAARRCRSTWWPYSPSCRS